MGRALRFETVVDCGLSAGGCCNPCPWCRVTMCTCMQGQKAASLRSKARRACRRRRLGGGATLQPPRQLGPSSHLAVQLESHCHGISAVRGLGGLHDRCVVGSLAHWRPPYRRPRAGARAGGRQARHHGPCSAGSSHGGPHGACKRGVKTDRRWGLSGGARGLTAASSSNHKQVAAGSGVIPSAIGRGHGSADMSACHACPFVYRPPRPVWSRPGGRDRTLQHFCGGSRLLA